MSTHGTPQPIEKGRIARLMEAAGDTPEGREAARKAAAIEAGITPDDGVLEPHVTDATILKWTERAAADRTRATQPSHVDVAGTGALASLHEVEAMRAGGQEVNIDPSSGGTR